MGDFSVACGLTGLAMTYDRAVLVPLAPCHFAEPNRKNPGPEHGAKIVRGEGAEMFAPVGLPFYGKLNASGMLDGIEETPHVQFLRSKGIDPYDFAQATAHGHDFAPLKKCARRYARGLDSQFKKRQVWNGRLWGMFVHREAWDAFRGGCLQENGESDDPRDVIRARLTETGTKWREEKKRRREHAERYDNDPVRSFTVVLDTTPPAEKEKELDVIRARAGRLFREGNVAAIRTVPDPVYDFSTPWVQLITDGTYYVRLVKVAVGKMDWSYVTPEEAVIYGANLAPLGERRRSLGDFPFREAHTCGLNEDLKAKGWKYKRDPTDRPNFAHLDAWYRRVIAPEMVGLYGSALFKAPLIEDMVDLVNINHTLFATNRLWGPQSCGYQYGNDYAHLEVAGLTLQILNTRIDRRRDRADG